MASRLTTDAVRAARRAIGDRLHTTPLLTSARTSERVGAEVLLKAELFQRTGSFKPRGVYAKLLQLTAQERKRGVVAASSGNHAQALAYCANALDIDCLAVMWPGASAQKIAAVRNYGAAVDLDSSNGTEAEHHATTIADRTGRILIPAYDDDAVMAGQGTLALELLEQIPDPHAILVPVSGGGLLAGVATAVKATKPKTRIIAVEPADAPALAPALRAGHPVPRTGNSIADGLQAPTIGQRCLPIIQSLVDEVVTVTEEEIADGTRWLGTAAKLACEPAGAATVAALLANRVELEEGVRVVAVVSGGNVDLARLSTLLAETGREPPTRGAGPGRASGRPAR
jgi:threonine dehydratase